jgi:hypothetical protein
MMIFFPPKGPPKTNNLGLHQFLCIGQRDWWGANDGGDTRGAHLLRQMASRTSGRLSGASPPAHNRDAPG